MRLGKGEDGQEHIVSCSEISRAFLWLWCKCPDSYSPPVQLSGVLHGPERADTQTLNSLCVLKGWTFLLWLLHGLVTGGPPDTLFRVQWLNTSIWWQNDMGRGGDRSVSLHRVFKTKQTKGSSPLSGSQNGNNPAVSRISRSQVKVH